jgi:hypothetical protein
MRWDISRIPSHLINLSSTKAESTNVLTGLPNPLAGDGPDRISRVPQPTNLNHVKHVRPANRSKNEMLGSQAVRLKIEKPFLGELNDQQTS